MDIDLKFQERFEFLTCKTSNKKPETDLNKSMILNIDWRDIKPRLNVIKWNGTLSFKFDLPYQTFILITELNLKNMQLISFKSEKNSIPNWSIHTLPNANNNNSRMISDAFWLKRVVMQK